MFLNVNYLNVNVLKGKTCTKIDVFDDEEIIFICDDGTRYKMYHWQSCCERVSIEDIAGDIEDLIGNPLLIAEDVSSEMGTPEGYEDSYAECHEWTFYKFATIKGYVTIRWYGTSNGYYSTSVDFEEMDPDEYRRRYC